MTMKNVIMIIGPNNYVMSMGYLDDAGVVHRDAVIRVA